MSNQPTSTGRREGALISVEGRPALRFRRRYRHPVDRVWRAVSDPAEMARWFPSNVEGERAVGGELMFVDEPQRAAAREAGEPARDDGGPFIRGRVVAWDPPKVFSFTWGSELLRFELLPEGDATVLVFTQVLSHQSVAARNASGWHACLGALDRLLGAAGDAESTDAWPDVYGGYLSRMGPSLGAPSAGGAMTWERFIHVGPDRIRSAAADAGEIAGWGATPASLGPVRWDLDPTGQGTVYRVTHPAVGDDAELAATWHALLLQLDMYLCTGQLVPADPKDFLPAYEELLSPGGGG